MPENSGRRDTPDKGSIEKDNVPQTTGNQREWQIDRLTTEYLNRLEKGERVEIAEYTSRYPEIATELRENLLYFALQGSESLKQVAEEEAGSEYRASLSETARNSTERARISGTVQKIEARATPENPISSLYKIAAERKIKPPELAKQVGITPDILLALQQRTIKLAGIPGSLINRLAEALSVSSSQVARYLGGPPLASANHLNHDKPAEAQKQDFKTSVRQSSMLTGPQKEYWLQEASKNPFIEG